MISEMQQSREKFVGSDDLIAKNKEQKEIKNE